MRWDENADEDMFPTVGFTQVYFPLLEDTFRSNALTGFMRKNISFDWKANCYKNFKITSVAENRERNLL